MAVRLQSLQRLGERPVVWHPVRAARLRQPAERQEDQLAGERLPVGRGQQDTRVHNPIGSHMERRSAAHRSRRRFQLRSLEAASRSRPAVGLAGHQERDPARRRQGRLHVQPVGGTQLLPDRGADRDRAQAHLVGVQGPCRAGRQRPGRHRPVHDERLHRAEHHLQAQSQLLAEGAALSGHGQLPGVPRQRPRQRVPRRRPGAVGRPVHPQHRHLLRGQGPQEQPLLVPTDRQHQRLVQHDTGAARQQGCAAGDRLQHRSRRSLAKG